MLKETPLQNEARLRYKNADFDILKTGTYVVCAVSGTKIPLSRLRYWSVEHQEPYRDAELALKHWQHMQDKTAS